MPPKKDAQPEPKPLIGRVGTNLKVGIVGLPNVGKSTFFNILTKSEAPAENFPFCTIDPNENKSPSTFVFNWLQFNASRCNYVEFVLYVGFRFRMTVSLGCVISTNLPGERISMRSIRVQISIFLFLQQSPSVSKCR